MSKVGCLIVLLSHNGCLGNFFYISGDKTSWHTFLTSLCDTSVRSVKCWQFFKEAVTCWQCDNPNNYTVSLITSFLFVSHLTVWQGWHIEWDDVHWKNIWSTQLIFYVHWTVHLNEFKYNQQDAKLHNGIYYFKCSTYFRRFLRPSSGAQNSIHSIGYLSSLFCFFPLTSLGDDSGNKQKKLDKYPMLYIRFWAPDDGRRNSLKRVEYL